MSRQTGLAAQVHTLNRNTVAGGQFVAVVDHVAGALAAIIRPGQAQPDRDQAGAPVLYSVVNTVAAGDRVLVIEASGTWIVLGKIRT